MLCGIQGEQHVGEYNLSVMSEPAAATLISVPQIVDKSNKVCFEPTSVTISDIHNRYKVRFPRGERSQLADPTIRTSSINTTEETACSQQRNYTHSTRNC